MGHKALPGSVPDRHARVPELRAAFINCASSVCALRRVPVPEPAHGLRVVRPALQAKTENADVLRSVL